MTVPTVISRRMSHGGMPPASHEPALSHRPSLVSQSSSSWHIASRRVMSFASSLSSPGVVQPTPPVGHIAPQLLLDQLVAWSQSPKEAQKLKLYTWLRETMQRSIIFELFEDGPAVHTTCLRRLRALPHSELAAIVSQGKDIVGWRQDGIGPAKMSDPTSAADILGLLVAARGFFSASGLTGVCEVAKANISAQQPVEKRYNVVLLALAAALAPPERPLDYAELRQQCKALLQLMKNHRPKLQRERRLRLLKRIARALTHKRADKIAMPPSCTYASDEKIDRVHDNAVADTPSTGQFVLVDAKIPMDHKDVDGCALSAGAAPDKQAFVKRWLSGLWS